MSKQAGIPARLAAVELLSIVLDDNEPLEIGLQNSSSFDDLADSDRAFAHLLVKSCLRHLGEIDTAIKQFLKKPIPEKANRVRHILRIGATQLIVLKTAPHAAVDTSVRLAKGTRLAGFGGLINAVLRRISELESLEAEDAARRSTPDWLFESWTKEYGAETAADIAIAHLSEPCLDLTVRRSPSEFAEKVGGRLLPTGSIRLESASNVAAIDGFQEGEWWVQDAAAALPAQLIREPSGKIIYDLCAAPGGKAAQLFSAGAQVTAVDRSEKRLEIMRRNLERLGMSIELHYADVISWRPEKLADAVLLDAPCSATGTIRRHPDITLLKSLADVRRLAKLQLELIYAAAKLVRPGGHLVYAVCSLQPDESQRVVNKFLLNNDQFKRDPVTAVEVENISEFITPAGDIRTLPSHWEEWGGLDGFFAARLKRSTRS